MGGGFSVSLKLLSTLMEKRSRSTVIPLRWVFLGIMNTEYSLSKDIKREREDANFDDVN